MSERKIKGLDQKRRNSKRNTKSGAKKENLSRCEKMGLKSEKRFGRGTWQAKRQETWVLKCLPC